jgi:hypothetical protein
MYSLIDNLIFPAPKPGYSAESMSTELIYIPKFNDYNQLMKQTKIKHFEFND